VVVAVMVGEKVAVGDEPSAVTVAVAV